MTGSSGVGRHAGTGGSHHHDANRTSPDVDVGVPDDAKHLEAPLLGEGGVVVFKGRSGISGTMFNIMNTFIGAGIMSLPHAFAGLGLTAGVSMTVIVAVLIYIGLAVVVRVGDITGWRTYTEMTRHELGKQAGWIMQWSIILNNFGILIVYLIMIGDVLVGTPKNGNMGVVTDLANIHSGDVWYVSRAFVLLLICLIFIQPLVLQKRLHVLAHSSGFAVCLATTFGLLLAVLGIIAGVENKVGHITIGTNNSIVEPDIHNNCTANIIVQGLSVFLFAYVCNYNVPPLMAELKDYSQNRMLCAVKLAVVLTTILYLVISLGAWLAFGDEAHEDILVNLNTASLARFMHPHAARVVSFVVSLGYSAKLMLIYPMENWSLRENLSDLAFGTQRPTGWQFYVATYGITAAAYLASLYVKSVFVVVGFIGCTACSIIGFIIPAMFVKKFEFGTVQGKLIVAVFGLLSTLLLFHGLVGQAWRMLKNEPMFC